MDIKVAAGGREASVAALQGAFVALYDLSIVSKQRHWAVKGGAAFLPIHRALDEVVDFARGAYDTVAERLVQLGAVPDGRAGAIAQSSPLAQPVPGVALTVESVVTETATALMVLDGILTVGQQQLGEDLVSQNVLIDIATECEKLSWFWQASVECGPLG